MDYELFDSTSGGSDIRVVVQPTYLPNKVPADPSHANGLSSWMNQPLAALTTLPPLETKAVCHHSPQVSPYQPDSCCLGRGSDVPNLQGAYNHSRDLPVSPLCR
jgi:hypothetical protein